MLARSFRLKKREIDRVYKKGQRSFLDFGLVRTLSNGAKTSRFAIVIPKKTLPKSVDRSRLKRMTAIAIQENLSVLKSNYDIILNFKKLPQESEIAPQIKKIFSELK